MYPTILFPPAVTRPVDAPYEFVQLASSMFVMHLSTFVAILGNVVAEEYVPVQPEAEGSVRQLLTVVISVVNVVQVEVGHLPAST